MLVVVVIIGILASTIVLGIRRVGSRTEPAHGSRAPGDADRNGAIAGDPAQRGVGRRDRTANGYQFLVFDPPNHRWVEQKDGPFHPRKTADMTLSVKVDELTMPGDKTIGDAPNIIMFSSGEQTPFEIEITPQWKSDPWRVNSDGLSRANAQRSA